MSGRGVLALGLSACAAVLGGMLWQQHRQIDALQEHVARQAARDAQRENAERPSRPPTVVYAGVHPEFASSASPTPSGTAPATPREQGPERGWSREELNAYHDRVRDHTQQEFAAQARDATWATGAEVQLESRIRAMTPERSTLGRVECRDTICRVEAVHQSIEDYYEFQTQVFAPGDAIWSGARFALTRPMPDGKRQRTVAFYARDGHELPRLSE